MDHGGDAGRVVLGWPAHRALRAQNVVEYGLLLASIVVLVLLVVTGFEHHMDGWFGWLAGRITATGGLSGPGQ
jgi:Flp pilus assembly pilin Flp